MTTHPDPIPTVSPDSARLLALDRALALSRGCQTPPTPQRVVDGADEFLTFLVGPASTDEGDDGEPEAPACDEPPLPGTPAGDALDAVEALGKSARDALREARERNGRLTVSLHAVQRERDALAERVEGLLHEVNLRGDLLRDERGEGDRKPTLGGTIEGTGRWVLDDLGPSSVEEGEQNWQHLRPALRDGNGACWASWLNISGLTDLRAQLAAGARLLDLEAAHPGEPVISLPVSLLNDVGWIDLSEHAIAGSVPDPAPGLVVVPAELVGVMQPLYEGLASLPYPARAQVADEQRGVVIGSGSPLGQAISKVRGLLEAPAVEVEAPEVEPRPISDRPQA